MGPVAVERRVRERRRTRQPEQVTLDPSQLADNAIRRRAVEAVIWGMPAVNFDRMLRAAIANGAKPNQMVFWSQPVNSKNQTLTPNPDTIYLNPFYDTRHGPVVLEIPHADAAGAIVGSVDNSWQNALEDVGPAGADKGKGGKYLITPPGHTDEAPGGYIMLRSDTYQGFAILRSNFKSRRAEDIAAAVEYGKKVKIYPLGSDPDSTVYVDMYDKVFNATIPYYWRFFDSLHHFVQVEPWLPRDKVMIHLLESIGIEKGKPFDPDERTKAIFEEATRAARAEIDLQYAALFVPPFNEGTHWAVPASMDVVEGMGTGFADPNSYPVAKRATSYAMGYFSAKHLGAGQYYLMSLVDSAGTQLEGKNTYRLTVPPNAPVEQYWSATVYDRETHALIRGTSRSSRASNGSGLQKSPDGSVHVFFGPRPLTGKESNWVPTRAGGQFEVMFRLYGPQKPLFDKSWKLPDIERLNS